MGKGNHPRRPPVKPATTGASPPSPSVGRWRGNIFSRRTGLQLPAILALSCVLGFTFNAASPLGVRFAPTVPPAPAPVREIAVEPSPPTPLPAVVAAVPAVPTEPPPAVPEVFSNPLAPAPAATPPTEVVAITNFVPVTAPAASPVITPPNPAAVHWPEVKALVAQGGAVLVDVRHKAMYDAGHIPGAVSLPESSSVEEITAFLQGQPANMMVVVYCSSTSCSQSARVANRLVSEFHWPLVRYMTGGYMEYQQAELARPSPPPGP